MEKIHHILNAIRDIAPEDKEPDWSLEIEQPYGIPKEYIFRLRGPIVKEEEIQSAIKPIITQFDRRSVGSWKPLT